VRPRPSQQWLESSPASFYRLIKHGQQYVDKGTQVPGHLFRQLIKTETAAGARAEIRKAAASRRRNRS
jgi:hypothetical protein